jgi:hypothetical protein
MFILPEISPLFSFSKNPGSACRGIFCSFTRVAENLQEMFHGMKGPYKDKEYGFRRFQ